MVTVALSGDRHITRAYVRRVNRRLRGPFLKVELETFGDFGSIPLLDSGTFFPTGFYTPLNESMIPILL